MEFFEGVDTPITTDEGAVIGAVEGFSVAVSGDRRSLEIRGVLFEVPQLGLDQVRWSTSIPIAPGWTLVRLEEASNDGSGA